MWGWIWTKKAGQSVHMPLENLTFRRSKYNTTVKATCPWAHLWGAAPWGCSDTAGPWPGGGSPWVSVPDYTGPHCGCSHWLPAAHLCSCTQLNNANGENNTGDWDCKENVKSWPLSSVLKCQGCLSEKMLLSGIRTNVFKATMIRVVQKKVCMLQVCSGLIDVQLRQYMYHDQPCNSVTYQPWKFCRHLSIWLPAGAGPSFQHCPISETQKHSAVKAYVILESA